MLVSAIWNESTPPATSTGDLIQQSGVRSTTRVFFARESCEHVQAVGTSPETGGVQVQLLSTASGFIAATLVDTDEVLVSASFDFTVDGLAEVQTVRILNLRLRDGDRCASFF